MKYFAALLLVFSFSVPTMGQTIVAEDFLYNQPTKGFGAGGGFTRQDYGGGQHGTLGQWSGRWVSFGDGVITGSDISDEAFAEIFVPETDMFKGATRNGLSDNWLDRDYNITGLDDEQTLFFGITMRSNSEDAQPNATFSINDAGGEDRIGMGFTEGGFRAILGDPETNGFEEVLPGPEITSGLEPHRLIGKLEINALGSDERLTVWLDPTDVETAEESVSVEVDVVTGLSEFNGNLRLDQVRSPGLMFWDDLAIGTTWESVASVNIPRLSLLVDTDTREVKWKNETGSDLDVTFVQVESGRSFTDRRWESFTDQGKPGFAENSPTSNRLTESSLFGSLELSDGQSVSWGRIYRGGEDLEAQVGTSDGLLNIAEVQYGEFPDEAVDTDFDDDGTVDVADIDALCSQISLGGNDAAFDLTGDGVVNGDDLANFMEQTGALAGDTNLDGAVNFPDFLALSSNFTMADRTWSHGDIDCNGTVEFPDFLALSSNFGQTAEGTASSVPEPNAATLSLLAIVACSWLRRRR